MNTTTTTTLPNPWLMFPTVPSSPAMSKSILTLLRNLSISSMNNSDSHKLSPQQTNDSRFLHYYYHHFILPALYSNTNVSILNNESFEYINCPSYQNPMQNVVAIILYLVVCIVGLFGNSLVIYVVLRFSKMQTVTNRYILNLALADECFLIGIPFLLTTMYLNEWIFGDFICKVYMISTSVTQFTSSIFLLIMSADRFIAVCHPISSPRFRTPLLSKIVSLIAWGMSALIMSPIFFYATTLEKFPGSKQMTCNIMWSHPNTNDEVVGGLTFTLYTLILGFAMPLSLILVFYYLVIKKLQTVGPKNKSKDKKRSHRKVTRLVLTVITVYILCWTPYWVSQIALINTPPDVCQTKLEITVFILAGCLGYSNSAINPVLYAFLSDNFKKSFMKACLCARGKDLNAQLQVENSFFPRFGKSRGSEKLTSIAKNNLHKANGGVKETEAVVIMEKGGGGGGGGTGGGVGDKKNKISSNVCIKTTTTTISACNHPVSENNKEINGFIETMNNRGQRTQVLHTDL